METMDQLCQEPLAAPMVEVGLLGTPPLQPECLATQVRGKGKPTPHVASLHGLDWGLPLETIATIDYLVLVNIQSSLFNSGGKMKFT